MTFSFKDNNVKVSETEGFSENSGFCGNNVFFTGEYKKDLTNMSKEFWKKNEVNGQMENNTQALNIQIGKKYAWEIPAKYSEDGSTEVVGEGEFLIFNADNSLQMSSYNIPSTACNYNGTYKVNGNKIIASYTQWEDEEIHYENSTETYTILDNTQIKAKKRKYRKN